MSGEPALKRGEAGADAGLFRAAVESAVRVR